jgi:hypothetical protein
MTITGEQLKQYLDKLQSKGFEQIEIENLEFVYREFKPWKGEYGIYNPLFKNGHYPILPEGFDSNASFVSLEDE